MISYQFWSPNCAYVKKMFLPSFVCFSTTKLSFVVLQYNWAVSMDVLIDPFPQLLQPSPLSTFHATVVHYLPLMSQHWHITIIPKLIVCIQAHLLCILQLLTKLSDKYSPLDLKLNLLPIYSSFPYNYCKRWFLFSPRIPDSWNCTACSPFRLSFLM